MNACGTGESTVAASSSSESDTMTGPDSTGSTVASHTSITSVNLAATSTATATAQEGSSDRNQSSDVSSAVTSTSETDSSEDLGSGSASHIGNTSHTGSEPATSSDCPRVELITNGTFDLAEDTAWIQSSAQWQELITTEESVSAAPQSGRLVARLGGYVGTTEIPADDTLIQTVPVPQSATELAFSVYTLASSEERSPQGKDTLYIALDSEAVYADLALSDADVHSTWQRYEQEVSSMAAGKTLVLLISAHNDEASPTTFLVDSVSLTAKVCP